MSLALQPPLVSLTFWGEKRLIVTFWPPGSQDEADVTFAVNSNLGPFSVQTRWQQSNSVIYENQ